MTVLLCAFAISATLVFKFTSGSRSSGAGSSAPFETPCVIVSAKYKLHFQTGYCEEYLQRCGQSIGNHGRKCHILELVAAECYYHPMG